jgi:glycosyltransferase involved in cell wall biosynthesis
MLARYVLNGSELPPGYKFAPMATWIEALLARGHEVTLFTLAPEATEPRTFVGDRLTIHVGRYRSQHRARDFFALERHDLTRAMLQDRCDIIHAHWTYEFALAALATGFPTLITIHDSPLSVLRYNRSPYRFMRTLMAWEVARRAPYMTAVTDDVERHFRRFLGYRHHLTVIGNAVSASVFNFAESFTRTSNRPFTFATVLCGWGGLKNGQTALRAFQKLRIQVPHASLIMFGEQHGPGEDAELWAQKHHLTENVRFAGMVPYAVLMEELATVVDVLLHPAFVEAHSMAVAEALALGLPVIAGKRTGGMRYLLENGKVGLLVDVASENAVADAMGKLALDEPLRRSLARTASASARTRFSADAITRAYEKEYEHVLEHWPSGMSELQVAAG